VVSLPVDAFATVLLAQALSPREGLVKQFSKAPSLDGGYLSFNSLVCSLTLPSGLARDHLFRRSERGRKYYGAVLTKPEWKTEPFDDSDRWRKLSVDNRHIHIESQYDVLAQALKVYVHYETNPYYPVSTLKKCIHPDQYEAYRTRRRAFVHLFTDVVADPFRVRVRSNQLASVEVPLSGNRVTEVQHEMQKLIGVAADAKD
jgi:hypothetical protein